jgi:hypothetical protein
MPRIAAVHYPLGHVQPGAGSAFRSIDIKNAEDRPAVQPDPELKIRTAPQRLRDLQSGS